MSAPPPAPELIARAVQLRHEGLSYAAIAESCDITKGAVAGILWRAGACVSRPYLGPVTPIRRKRKADAPKPPEPVRLPVPVLPSRLLPPGPTCCWPTWEADTPRELRRWCGDPTGGPAMAYCVEHWRMAYLPQREMRA